MGESELLSRAECRRIFDIAWSAAKSAGAEDVEVTFGATVSSLTRFANNEIHQNVAERRGLVSIRPVLDSRTARASTNRLDERSIQATAAEAVAITRAQEPDPELLPVFGAAEYRDVDRFCTSTALATPEDRAAVVAEAIGIAEAASQTAAGIYSTGQTVDAILNSRGAFGYYYDTNATFSMTAIGADSSGWAKLGTPDCGLLDPIGLARRASLKATASAGPRELPPGRYTVILEPSAAQDLIGQMFFDFSATSLHDQHSFLNGRIGTKLFGENISIMDNVYHPLQSGPPFDGEGVPQRILTLVDRGVVRDVAYSRLAAKRAGVEPTGHGLPVPSEAGEMPDNIVIMGGDASLEGLIASTEHGILITRLWYIREVDPYEKIMTGLTRDGTFLIEGGRIVSGLRNFRFNQSLIDMLNRVEAMTPAVRASGEEAFDMVAPAMKVREFNFTDVTKF
ncbi:MAG TPA: TldD/PmbA family protein [Bryobacteraceae bacterium]|nr:TldD/PmbA family protein [Bryobacteraceae bacterium]